MKARKYNKRIQIYEITTVPDGYGGSTNGEVLLGESWCSIASSNSQRLVDLGIIDPSNTIVVRLRWRNDLRYNAIDQFLKYNGVKYIIQNAPINIDFEKTEVEIIAVREDTSSVWHTETT